MPKWNAGGGSGGLTPEQIINDPTVRAAFGTGVVTGLGTADDTAVIAAAFTSSTDKVLVIPAGATANLPTTLTIPADRVLRIERGATVQRTGAGTDQPIILSAGAVLEGSGIIDAAGLADRVVSINGDAATVRGVHVTGATTYGIACGAWAELRVEDCEFSNLGSYGIFLDGAALRPMIRGNRLNGSQQGIMLKGGVLDAVVANNIVQATAGVAIEVFGAATARATVTGNTVTGTPTIGISLSEADGCAVTGNIVTGHTEMGIEVAQGASFTTITGNTVNASSGAAGVGIALTTPDQATLPLSNVTVYGNTITDQGVYGINLERGVNVSISGNSIIDSGDRDIFLNNSPNRCLIADNVIRHTVANTGPAIWVTGADHHIDGNVVDYTGVTNTGKGILLEQGSGHSVLNNRIIGPQDGIEANNAGACVIDGNRTTATTRYSVLMYGGNTATTHVLAHTSAIAGGSRIGNNDGATITGPLVDL